MITAPKKPLFLSLPYLGPLSLQTKTNKKISQRYFQLLQITDHVQESKQISKSFSF